MIRLEKKKRCQLSYYFFLFLLTQINFSVDQCLQCMWCHITEEGKKYIYYKKERLMYFLLLPSVI